MHLRTVAVLLAFTLPAAAEEPPPVLFPLETSGGAWTAYEPGSDLVPGLLPRLYHRGDEVLVQGSHALSVNRRTGVATGSPRPAFPSELETIHRDGDSPVFWTMPRGVSPPGPYHLRDWSSGEKLGEVTLPAGLYPDYIDPYGMATATPQLVYATDPLGQNARQVRLADLGVSGGQISIKGCEDWLALSYRTYNTFQLRVAILDRATLALTGDHVQTGSELSLHGDLLATKNANQLMLYQLPGMTAITGVPQSPASTGVRHFQLVEGGLWVQESVATREASVFRHFDLENLPSLRLRHRLSPPGPYHPPQGINVPWVAKEDYLALIDPSKTLWIWNRDPDGDPHRPLVTVQAWAAGTEGGNARAKLTLSDPVSWPVEVMLHARSGSAVEGSDFAPWSRTITIPAGTDHVMADVPILADTVLEPNETFELIVESAAGAVAEVGRMSLTIDGNGYNLEVNPPSQSTPKMTWTRVVGFDGKVQVGQIAREPGSGGFGDRSVAWAVEKNTLLDLAALVPYNLDRAVMRDGLLMMAGDSSFSACRTDTGALVGSWPFSNLTLVDAVTTDKVLVRQYYPEELQLRLVSDGTLLASIPFSRDRTVGLSHDRHDGSPSTIHTYTTSRENSGRLILNRLSQLDPDTLATLPGPVWRAANQSYGDIGKILTVWHDKVILSVEYGIAAVDRTTGAPLWHLPAATSGTAAYGTSISGNVMAVSNLFTGSAESTGMIHFVDLDRGAVIARLAPAEVNPTPLYWGFGISAAADDGGWNLISRNSSFRVLRSPVRPNVKLVTEVIPDNGTSTVKVLPLEGFPGTFPLRISEFEDINDERPVNKRLLDGLPADVQLDADGVEIALSSLRSVNGFENTLLRATAPGRRTQFAGITRTVVDAHLTTVPNGAFTTGGPVRATRARSVAVSEPLLAVGYPLELASDGIRQGLVDVFNRQTGAFLRTLEAPAGTEGKRFGHAVGVAGSKVIVGAPGQQTAGRVFAYDGNTGTLIQELVLKGKAGEFGSVIAVNSRWIAVSAIGLAQPPKPGSEQKATGTVMVFDAATLKPVMTKSTKGEGFGISIALSGDKLFVSAPGAPYKKMFSVGLIRAFSIPKGKQLATIMAREPAARESFGHYMDASDSVLVIGGVFDRTTTSTGALQVHSTSTLGFLGHYSMPGDNSSYSRVKAHGDWMIGGGLTLRFFRPDNFRPVASRRITDPGGPNTWPSPYYFWESNLAAHGDVLYWADYAPKSMALPEIPGAAAARMLAAASAGDDPNGDGRSDELDLLFLHRGDASLPVRATPQEANDGSLRFRLQADPGVPPGMDLWFEVSTDLNRWDALLQWRQESPGWRDAAGSLLEIPADGSVATEYRSEATRVFFRTRAARR